MTTKHPSDSSEQLTAEIEMIASLAKRLKCKLNTGIVKTPEGKNIAIDGISEQDRILVEIYAHIGKLKGAQYKKVLTDAFKLIYAEQILGTNKWRKILVFADNEAAAKFQSGTWYSESLKANNFAIEVVPLSSAMHASIVNAQKRQKMTNIVDDN